jgi:hypothetical protein
MGDFEQSVPIEYRREVSGEHAVPIILPISIQFFTPAMIADATGKSTRTVYDRYDQLVARGQMKRHRRALWDREEAQTLANYIAVSSRQANLKK